MINETVINSDAVVMTLMTVEMMVTIMIMSMMVC